MEEALRYIVIVFIIWAVCRKIYKTVSSRTLDYASWAIIVLSGIVIMLSRSFLVTCRIYDWSLIIVVLLVICSDVFSRKSAPIRWIKVLALSCLSVVFVGFISLSIIADRKDRVVIETPLTGYSTARIDEIYFRYEGKPFGRSFNLKDYSNADNLIDKYNVELIIIPITPCIAKIESLNLVQKH